MIRQLGIQLTDEEETKVDRLAQKVATMIDDRLYLDHPLDDDEKLLVQIAVTLFFNELKQDCKHGCAA